MIALVDCNNFYASCERVFQPNLNGKPVAILSNNDGCIIARSNEVKALGIPMGAPAFKFATVFKQHEVTLFSSNFTLYGDMSARVMNILEANSPKIEIYSIDEAFLRFEEAKMQDYTTYGKMLYRKVLRSTGIPTSIGFASTKTLAKVANRIAKKFPKRTEGIYIIDTEEKRIKALKWLKIEDVWGIGRQLSKKLKYVNVHTAYGYTQLSDAWIKRNISIVGLRLKQELLGKSVLGIEDEFAQKKSIATTRSFSPAITDFECLRERVATFAVNCAEKLRKQNSVCRTLMVFVRTSPFRKDLPQYKRNIIVQLPCASNSNIDLVKSATSGLEQIFKPNISYKKAGVIALDICSKDHLQLNIFDCVNEKHPDLMRTIDSLNECMGRGTIKLASQGIGGSYWNMKQEKISKRYSTNLNELIEIVV